MYFLNKYALKNAFLVGFGARFGEQNALFFKGFRGFEKLLYSFALS